MAIEVVNLTEADIPEAIEVIQHAFADDPYFKWVFNPAKVCSLVMEHAEDTVEVSCQIKLELTCAVSRRGRVDADLRPASPDIRTI